MSPAAMNIRNNDLAHQPDSTKDAPGQDVSLGPLPLTRKALEEYEASQAQLDAAFDAATTNDEVWAAFAADEEAADKVRRAIEADTADINEPGSYRNCKVSKIKRIVDAAMAKAIRSKG